MKFGNAFRLGVTAMSVALAASAVQAGPLYFFGNTPGVTALPTPTVPETNPTLLAQTAFTETVVSPPIAAETFENATPGFLGYSAGPLLSILGIGTLSQAAIPFSNNDPINGDPLYSGPWLRDAPSSGRFNTTQNGSQFFESDWSFTVDIGRDVDAFAFFGTDFGDFNGSLTIELWLDGVRKAANVFLDPSILGPDKTPQLFDQDDTNDDNGSVLFFGFANDEYKFDQLVFKIAQGSTDPTFFDTLGFDDLRVANLRAPTDPTPAPEPGSLALVGLALFAASWARKTQRRA